MIDADVIVYDTNGPNGAFAPEHNASKPTGGSEVHLCQLAEGLAATGLSVLGVSDINKAEEQKANYIPRRLAGKLRCRALISCGVGPLPLGVETDKHVVLWTHAPQHNLPFIGHLRFTDIVCVSEWQASQFPFGWRTTVIPPIVDDWIYDLPEVEKDPDKFVCFSAWWKGGMETLVIWEQLRKPGQTLFFGSPYSHPEDLKRRVDNVPGCVYTELGNPRDVVEKMRDAAGVFRVSMHPETFGVTDHIASRLGCDVNHWAAGGVGGSLESVGMTQNVTQDRGLFDRQWVLGSGESAPVGDRLRPSNIIPAWLKTLQLS